MAVSGINIVARLTAKLTKSVADTSVPTQDYSAALYKVAPTDADLFYNNRLTVGNGSNQTLDLSGALEDALGVAAVFSKVYGLYLFNRSTTAADKVHLGVNAASVPIFGAAADYVIIGPQGCALLCNPTDGWVVTSSSADIIEIANPGGNNIDVDIAILGKA